MGFVLPRSDIATVPFPEYLRAGGMEMRRVDDPLTRRIAEGEPLFGWGGDNRLSVYIAAAKRNARWCLVRYCEDCTYQVITTAPAVVGNANAVIGRFIDFLVGGDARRGFDLAASVEAANAKAEADAEADLDTYVEEEGGPKAAKAMLAAMDR